MTPPSYLTVRIAVLLLAFAGQLFAGNPPLLTTGVEVGSSNERTALNRATRNLSSTVDVKIKNTSDRLLEAPLHAVIAFTPQNGGNLTGLTMPNTPGGIGVAPYQTFYKDLSASIGKGLAAGGETTFSFTFERPADTTVTYAVAIRGIRNSDPEASIGGPYSGQQGAPLSFNAGASSDPDGDALTFTWDFGDGTTAEGANPSHTFESSGIYTVILTATDARGAVVSKEIQVPISPPGIFALARTRTLDGNGHPLGDVTITQSGPDGSHPIVSDSISGFASLGGALGDHSWSFERSGYLTSFRKSTLQQGQVKVVPFPWLTGLNTDRTTLSLLISTPVNSPTGLVTLTLPTGAFEQVLSVAITELHGQSLPLPLPFGWSPLAAFHLDMPGEAAVDIPASLKLLQALTTTQTAVLARMDTDALTWNTESLITGTSADTLAAVLRKPGTYAVVIADTLTTGNPATAQVGQPLPAGTAPTIAAEVTAIGQVNPAVTVASLDPAKVTAQATVDFTNHTQPLASGAWFLADVGETYDLRDGQLLKTPDYDATFYAYQSPGDALAPTASAAFPLRPRLLYGPDQLTEAHIKVDVLSLNRFGGGIITPGGGKLSIPGVQVTVPAGAVSAPTAAEIRPLSSTNLAGFLGGFQGLLPFEINLPRLPDGTSLDLGITQKLKPGSNFVLARCVSSTRESGLQPVLRLHSDAQGQLISAEPATGPRLPGITGSGQYVIVQVTDPEALVTGLVRKLGGTLLPGAIVRAIGEPWLSLTGNAGTFFTLAKPGQRTVTGTDPADGNSGQATATLADANSTANVEIQTVTTGPQVVSTTPAASEPRASNVAPITVEFSEPIQPGSFGATGVRLRDVSTDTDVPGSLSLDLTNRKATLLPLNPLAYATDYEIIVSNTLLDRQSLPIEGTLTFAFKTASSPERPAGAQLVIYEPDAANVPPSVLNQLVGYEPNAKLSMVVATGSPGTADPEVPVILVNDNTGETATVLSKPDGSFATFIRAAEEDFINAVFVNANGTRVEVPATRQLFDTGQIGLYKYGGILEAEGEGGPVEVTIAPGSISQRNIFKLRQLPLAELLALVGGAEPIGDAEAVGAVSLQMEGEPLSEGADISIAATPEQLGIPATFDPTKSAFGLSRLHIVDGVKVYDIIDKAKYVSGRLTTASPPFLGFLGQNEGSLIFLKLGNGFNTVLTGRVVVTGNAGGEAPVPGAFVTTHELGKGGGRPVPEGGEIGTLADSNGSFRLLAPLSEFESSNDTILLSAVSNLHPGRLGTGSLRLVRNDSLASATGRVVFSSSSPTLSQTDFQSPKISATLADLTKTPVAGVPFEIIVNALDNLSVPSVEITSPAEITDVSSIQGATNKTRRVSILSSAGDVKVKVTATDEKNNSSTAVFTFTVAASAPVLPLIDPADTDPPFVIGSQPVDGDNSFDFRHPIRLIFNEPISASISDLTNAAVGTILHPAAGRPFVRISADKRTVELSYPTLNSGTQYTLSLNPTYYTDFAGIGIDQDRINSNFDYVVKPFVLNFKTRGADQPGTLQIENGGGMRASADGGLLVALDRGLGGAMRLYVTDGSGYKFLSAVDLPETPRDIVIVEGYDMEVPPRSTVSGVKIPGAKLICVVGGDVGSFGRNGSYEGLGPWVEVYRYIPATSEVKKVFGQRHLELGPTLFTKITYQGGRITILQSNGETTGVNLIDLQLYIWTHHPLFSASRDTLGEKGLSGIDLNSDGDYGDTGERIPLPVPNAPIAGFINGGLIDIASPPPGERIVDYDLALNGQFMSSVTSTPSTGATSLRVLRRQDATVSATSLGASVTLPEEMTGKRVFNLFGQEVVQSGTARIGNFILVSASKTSTSDAKLLVYEIESDESGSIPAPKLVATIHFPSGTKNAQSVQRLTPAFGWPDEGLLAVATSDDVFFLNPRLILEPLRDLESPALVGMVRAFGMGSRSYVALTNGTVGVASGGRSRLSTGVADIKFIVDSLFGEDVNQAPVVKTRYSWSEPTPQSGPVIRQSSRVAGDPDRQILEVVVDPNPAAVADTSRKVTDNALLGLALNKPLVPIAANLNGKAVVYAHANISPLDITANDGYPSWKRDGVTIPGGRDIVIEERFDLLSPHLSPSQIANLFINRVPYTDIKLESEGKHLDLHVFPAVLVQNEVDLTPVTTTAFALARSINALLATVSTNGFFGGAININKPNNATENILFTASFKECPDNNEVFFCPSTTVSINPLLKITGTVLLGPQVPAFAQLVVFGEGYGSIGVTGSIERTVANGARGTWKGSLAFPAKVGVAFGARLAAGTPGLSTAALASVQLKADFPVTIKGSVSIEPRWLVKAKLEAQSDGATGTFEVKINMLGGTYSQLITIPLLPPKTLINPPLETTLSTFDFN